MTKKLIIIDDSATQLNILKTFFVNDGWEVSAIQSAKIGFEMIFDFAPDLIITDAIMPLMGGFQLIKQIREDEKISKIPVIVYSVLNEMNAKFYIKEELNEYFLRKDNNYSELLSLANEFIKKCPLDKEYKEEILKIGLEHYRQKQVKEENTNTTEDDIQKTDDDSASIDLQQVQTENHEQFNINISDFISKLKENTDFKYTDEKNFKQILSVLYSFLDYDLAVINIFSFEGQENKVFFDIKDIILSPILKDNILNKFKTTTNLMYKKYAPNLTTIMQESEFQSKIEFNFKYKDSNIGDMIFYSREKLKWDSESLIEEIENALYSIMKARYIIKNSEVSKKDSIANKYFSFDKFNHLKNEQDVYFGIIHIENFSDLSMNMPQEEFDTINSKISEKIIACLEKEEKIYKNIEDEYGVVIFAKDKKHLLHRLNFILKELEGVSLSNSVQFSIIATSCMIDNAFNIIEAQKVVRNAFENVNEEKVTII